MNNDEMQLTEVVKLSQSEKREQVFVTLFLSGFYDEQDKAEAIATYYEIQNFSKELAAQLKERYESVTARLGEIDTLLAKYAIGWNLERIGKAEISILRLAAFEILYDESIPEKVAANEAVELAKKYGSVDSYGFINGIIGKVIQNSRESSV
ncbi:MAG: transcription antitermination factor NusB [Lachnospiraceae bacterium]|nr:transcription antitermination factor NusB [Lachnospiraceae bacterium]